MHFNLEIPVMKVSCPVCQQNFDIGDAALPVKIQCPCGQKFQIEAPPPEAAPPGESRPKFTAKPAPKIRDREIKRRPLIIWPFVALALFTAGIGGYLMKRAQAAAAEVKSDAAGLSSAPLAETAKIAPVGPRFASGFYLSPLPEIVVPPLAGKPAVADYKAWPGTYAGGPGFSTMEPENIDCAKRWVTSLGPLGLRCTAINKLWQRHPGFDAHYPAALKDSEGRIFRDGLEVVEVMKGSPAEGLVKVGDVIIGMDGEALKDALLIEPETAYKTKDARSLAMHAGWLIDRAEGRGSIRLEVLRGLQQVQVKAPVNNWISAGELKRSANASVTAFTGKDKTEMPLSLNLPAGARFATLEATCRGEIHGGSILWKNPRLVKADGSSIDLSQSEWLSASTGYGSIRRASASDPLTWQKETLDHAIASHVATAITYAVPPGCVRLEATGIRVAYCQDIDFTLSGGPDADFNADLALPAGQELRLELPPKSRVAMNQLVLENAEGRRIPLSNLKTPAKHGEQNETYLLPEGAWKLRGGLFCAAASCKISVLPKLPLPAALSALRQEIALKLPAIGSFASGFPAVTSPKTDTITAMNTEWILKQQRPDGSWPRRAGYCSDLMDTGICCLALMSTGDDTVLPAVKKAVKHLCDNTNFDGWSAASSFSVIAVCEYWLRTQDDSVLPFLRMSGDGLARFIYGDYTSGHGANPGYDDGGINYGGSQLCLALALLEKTPAKGRPELLEKMLWRVQQMAPDGDVPYTRGGGKFTDIDKGGAYGARGGAYLVAARLHGGPAHFIKECTAHYCERTLGSGDQGHATKTFSLFGSTIGIACSDDKAYAEFARRFGWQIAITRRFDGGFCWNSEPLEYMGAEEVMNDLFRASTMLIFLNAPKKKLAITGRPDLFPSTHYSLPKLTDADHRVWLAWTTRYEILRQQLGSSAPASLGASISALRNLEKSEGEKMRSRIFAIVSKAAPELLKAVESSPLNPSTKAQLIELTLGVDHRIDFVRPRGAKLCEELRLMSTHPFAEDLDTGKDAELNSPYRLTGKITFQDPSHKVVKNDLVLELGAKGYDASLGANVRQEKIELATDAAPMSFHAIFDYQIGGKAYRYERDLHWPDDVLNNRVFWVPGTVDRDHLRHSLAFRISGGGLIDTVSVPREGDRISLLWNNRTYKPDEGGDFQLLKGVRAEFALEIQPWRVVPIHTVAVRNPRFDEPAGATLKNDALSADLKAISDWNPDSSVEVPKADVVTPLATWSFPTPVSVKRAFVLKKGGGEVYFEAFNQGAWVRISPDSNGGLVFLLPGSYQQIRLVAAAGGRKGELSEVHFFSGE